MVTEATEVAVRLASPETLLAWIGVYVVRLLARMVWAGWRQALRERDARLAAELGRQHARRRK